MELHDYLKLEGRQGESLALKDFEALEAKGKKMFESVNLEAMEKGKHIYGSWIAIEASVDPEIKKAFRNKSLIGTYKQYYEQGFRSMILRASSPKSVHIYSMMGGKALSECEAELKGEKLPLKLMELSF